MVVAASPFLWLGPVLRPFPPQTGGLAFVLLPALDALLVGLLEVELIRSTQPKIEVWLFADPVFLRGVLAELEPREPWDDTSIAVSWVVTSLDLSPLGSTLTTSIASGSGSDCWAFKGAIKPALFTTNVTGRALSPHVWIESLGLPFLLLFSGPLGCFMVSCSTYERS